MVSMNAVEELVNAIKEPQYESIKTYVATITRKDKEGTIWVKIAGSESETPTASTSSEVDRGDVVSVEWRNNKLYIVGNSSNPSAGIIRVEAVENATKTAKEAAENAVKYAGEASEAAEYAQAKAEEAEQTATAIEGIAIQASSDAQTANRAASASLVGLASVQDVVGVINWISQHGRYVKSDEPSVTNGRTYFTVAGSVVSEPKNSEIQFYYLRTGSGTEQSPYVYTLTTDTSVDSQKTYYKVNATPVSNIPENANPSELNWYQLESVDEAVQSYIADHLSISEQGLSLVADNLSSRTLITNGYYAKTTDTSIIQGKDYYILVNGSYTKVATPVVADIATYYNLVYKTGTHFFVDNKEVAYYGTDTQIGDSQGFNLKITSTELGFYEKDRRVAYLNNNTLYITQSVVVNEMQVGERNSKPEWTWKYDKSDRSLYLKWIGV